MFRMEDGEGFRNYNGVKVLNGAGGVKKTKVIDGKEYRM